MIKKIITNLDGKDTTLFKPCAPAPWENKAERKLIKKVVDNLMHTATHHREKCLGLSANQLGYSIRIFVMRTESSPFFHIINPELVGASGGMSGKTERCLSLLNPDGTLAAGRRVRRPKHITVKGYTMDKDGSIQKEGFHLKGIDARVFLHELDHLNGKVI